MGSKIFIEASCTNNIYSREKDFCSCYSQRFVRRLFSDRKKTWYNLVFLICFFISREERNKLMLLMRDKFSFPYLTQPAFTC